MKRFFTTLSLLFVMLIVGVTASGQTPFTVYYDMDGVIKSPVPESVSATSSVSGIAPLLLTRGAGIEPAALTNGFSASGWDMSNPSLESAVATNTYYEFGLTVQAGYTASLTELDLSLRRSAKNGPMNYALYASLDNFATPGVLVDTWMYQGRTSGTAPAVDPTADLPYYYVDFDLAGRPNTTTSPGDAIPTLNLSAVAELQNIPGNTDVTFRMYAWGNASTTASNTVALGRMVGPKIAGTITAN